MRHDLWADAFRACERALADRPERVSLWVALSVAAARTGDGETAQGAYEMARALAPEGARLWHQALECAAARGPAALLGACAGPGLVDPVDVDLADAAGADIDSHVE
jgi:hypothetical protein